MARLERQFCPDRSYGCAKRLERTTKRLRVLEESALSFRDSRRLFPYANRRLSGSVGTGSLSSGSRTVVYCVERADLFTEFFHEVFADWSASTLDDFGPAIRVVVTPESVYGKLFTTPDCCSRTPDGIPPFLYRRLALELCAPSFLIYSHSYEDGLLPRVFKTTLVTPEHKEGDRCVTNYRPVAQTSVAWIAFEKILVEHISSHQVKINKLA